MTEQHRPTRPAARAAALLVMLCALTAAGPRVSGQASPALSSAPPYVAVEFRALLADGRPYGDLRLQDVELKVDGRTRTLHALVFVEPGQDLPASAPSAAPPPFATNLRAAPRRDTIFVVEDESLGASMAQAVKEAIRQFMGRLAPQDRVGLATIPRGGLNVGLTTDRAVVEAAIEALSGRAARAESEADAACRTRQVLDALMNVARGLAGNDHASVVVFGAGLTPPMFTEMSKMSNTPNLCEIKAKDYQEVELALLAAPASVHVVQVPDPTTSGAAATSSQTQGLEHLAGITGNEMIRLVGASDEAMKSLAAATSAYYRATFIPEDSERNGLARPLSVRVSRPEMTVRARPAVLIPDARRGRGTAKAVSPRDMLRVGDAFTALPLRAAAYVSRETSAGRARVVVMAEPLDQGVTLKAASAGFFDEKGKLVAQASADEEGLARTPPMIATVVPAGRYRMRVAAVDAAGRTGAVDSTMEAKLGGDGPLALSSLVLGVSADGRFAGRMLFHDEPTAVAYLEIYGAADGEVAAELQLSEGEDGPVAVRGAMRITGGEGNDRRVALGGIPIGQLPPGDIVVRAVVSLDGKPVGSASRTLRKAER